MTGKVCATCGHEFDEGEPGWVEDVKVIKTTGQRAVVTLESRYTCDTCEAKR